MKKENIHYNFDIIPLKLNPMQEIIQIKPIMEAVPLNSNGDDDNEVSMLIIAIITIKKNSIIEHFGIVIVQCNNN